MTEDENVRAALALASAWSFDPDEDANVRFERIAEWFHRETGMLRPGKSQPIECHGSPNDEERQERFTKWCEGKARALCVALRAALAASAEAVQPHEQSLFVIFDGPPSNESGRFVEVETAEGRSVGKESGCDWKRRPDGLWSLGPFYAAEQMPAVQPAVPTDGPQPIYNFVCKCGAERQDTELLVDPTWLCQRCKRQGCYVREVYAPDEPAAPVVEPVGTYELEVAESALFLSLLVAENPDGRRHLDRLSAHFRVLIKMLRHLYAAPPAPASAAQEPNHEVVRRMDANVARGEVGLQLLVDRFLRWPLPASVRSDDCACIQGYPHRIGTNLLTATEAEAMLRFVLDAPASAAALPEHREDRRAPRLPTEAIIEAFQMEGRFSRREAQDMYEKLIEALPRASALPDQWRDIASAPPPYQELLGWTKEGVEIVFYQREDGGHDGKKAGRWYGGEDGSIERRVTHWMPIPKAPTVTP